jgi:hypothetical protein
VLAVSVVVVDSLAGCSSNGSAPAPAVSDASAGDAASGDAASGDAASGDSAAPLDCADAAPPPDDAGSCDEGDAGTSGPCPTTGAGSIATPGGECLVFTPTATGASCAGENANALEYAISPDTNANGKLVLFINGTLSHPSESIASPTKNFYNAAAQLGYQVLAISYRSDETIADQCDCVDACYFPSRESVIRGVYQTGASCDLTNIRVDEGSAGRAALALQWLATHDASHGWSSYLTSAAPTAPPETQIDWSKIVTAGHSQGGGHAAACGKLFPVARVVQLSASCDTVTPPGECSHTTGSIADATPASWTSATNGVWQTPPASYWGLDIQTVYDGNTWVSGDGACFLHAAIWQDEGMSAAQENDDAAICGATTIVQNHDASIACDGNFAAWQTMLR